MLRNKNIKNVYYSSAEGIVKEKVIDINNKHISYGYRYIRRGFID
jgi:hypothetical protein